MSAETVVKKVRALLVPIHSKGFGAGSDHFEREASEDRKITEYRIALGRLTSPARFLNFQVRPYLWYRASGLCDWLRESGTVQTIMPNNFYDLMPILQSVPKEVRDELAKLIGAPFGSEPKLICDHLCFLGAGAVRQFFDNRAYRDIVIDVADRLRGVEYDSYSENDDDDNSGLRTIDFTFTSQTPTEEIEDEILKQVDLLEEFPDIGVKAPREVMGFFARTLTEFFALGVPDCASCARAATPFASEALEQAFLHLNPNWRKLLSGILFIRLFVRPEQQVRH